MMFANPWHSILNQAYLLSISFHPYSLHKSYAPITPHSATRAFTLLPLGLCSYLKYLSFSEYPPNTITAYLSPYIILRCTLRSCRVPKNILMYVSKLQKFWSNDYGGDLDIGIFFFNSPCDSKTQARLRTNALDQWLPTFQTLRTISGPGTTGWWPLFWTIHFPK